MGISRETIVSSHCKVQVPSVLRGTSYCTSAVYEEDDDNYGGNDDGGDYDQIIDEQQNAENIPPMTGVDERGDQNKTTAASQNANNAEKVLVRLPL